MSGVTAARLAPRRAGDTPDALLLDLDGTVYAAGRPLPGALLADAAARAAGTVVRYVTNNAFRTPSQVADRLRAMGLAAEPGDVSTSAVIAVDIVADRHRRGELPEGPVAVVGGPGLLEPLAAAGLPTVPARDALDLPSLAALVQGFSPETCWPDLAAAAYLAAAGTWWVATNLDTTIPTDRGIAPGNGSLVAAVAAAAGRRPDAVAGKPDPVMIRLSLPPGGEPARSLLVGDRLDTDIAAARAAGVPAMQVLVGVHGVGDLLAAPPSHRPDHIGRHLGDLAVDHPEVVATEPGRARCGAALAQVRVSAEHGSGDAVAVELTGVDVTDPAVAAGEGLLDAVRALCVAGWTILDTLEPGRRAAAAAAMGRAAAVHSLGVAVADCGQPAAGGAPGRSGG